MQLWVGTCESELFECLVEVPDAGVADASAVGGLLELLVGQFEDVTDGLCAQYPEGFVEDRCEVELLHAGRK